MVLNAKEVNRIKIQPLKTPSFPEDDCLYFHHSADYLNVFKLIHKEIHKVTIFRTLSGSQRCKDIFVMHSQ